MASSKLKPLIVSAGFGLHPASIKPHSLRATVVLILESQALTCLFVLIIQNHTARFLLKMGVGWEVGGVGVRGRGVADVPY